MKHDNLSPIDRAEADLILSAFDAIWPGGERWRIEETRCACCGRLFSYRQNGMVTRLRFCRNCYHTMEPKK